MRRRSELQRRLRTLDALSDAVRAMRSLAAHHFLQVRSALDPAREYRRELDRMIDLVGLQQSWRGQAPTGVLVLASNLGLCGDYNSRLADAAEREAERSQASVLYVVGQRVAGLLRRRKRAPTRLYEAPSTPGGLTQLLAGLAEDLLADYHGRRIGSLQAVSAKFQGVGRFEIRAAALMPIPSRTPRVPVHPTPHQERRTMMRAVVREFLFISLQEIGLDALASEHGMRLAAAESALDWLGDAATTAARRLATVRSEAATQELLDIVAGGRRQFRGSADNRTP